jgi:hypothetical protein
MRKHIGKKRSKGGSKNSVKLEPTLKHLESVGSAKKSMRKRSGKK